MPAPPKIAGWLLIVLLWLGACLGGGSRTTADDGAKALPAPFAEEQQIMAMLDEFIETFSRRDLDAHLKTYLFPHVRISSGKVLVFEKAEDVPRDFLETGITPDYDHSEWLSREIVQSSAAKVHVTVVFRRLRRDGSKIADFQSLYIIEKTAGKWRVRGRSSFAP